MRKDAAKKTQPEPSRSIMEMIPAISCELYAAARSTPLADPGFSFPTTSFAQAIAKTFSLKNASILPGEKNDWHEKEDVHAEVLNSSEVVQITLEGLPETSPCYLMWNSSCYTTWLAAILGTKDASLALNDPGFLSQFTSFLFFQILAIARSLPELSPLGVSLKKILSEEEKAHLDLGPCYLARYDLSLNDAKVSDISFVMTQNFWDHWKALRKPSLSAQIATLQKTTTVPVSVELGRSFLLPQQLSSLQAGDLLLIDYPFYRNDEEKARAILTLAGQPLFKAKVQGTSLKISEMPVPYEAFHPAGSIVATAQNPKAHTPKTSDPLAKEETMSPDSTISETSSHNDSLDEDLETNPFEGEEEETVETETTDTQLVEQSKQYLPPEKVDVTTLPHKVVVQLAQLHMTLDELATLGPGSIIDLQVSPKDLISLVVDNRVIALGELVALGDHIGVRIRETGLSTPSPQA